MQSPPLRPSALVLGLLAVASISRAGAQQTPAAPSQQARTGEQIFLAACAACHAPDGKGQPAAVLGFEPPPTFPDFTECAAASPENDYIWNAVVHRGGRVRALSHIMPAFGDALSDAEIQRVVDYLHALCAEPGWPRGNLNYPRAFVTEKAYPENEVVFTVNAVTRRSKSVENRIDYEHRIGRRAQYELGVPFLLQQSEDGQSWSRGLGDVNAAIKYAFYDNNATGTIAAAGGEVTLPTGKESRGLGGGVTIFEAFAMVDQALPGDGFVQLHAGYERPADHDLAPNAVYWRTAIGKTFAQDRWGRTWSPMVEILGDKDLEDGATAAWDVVPQMQVSLSTFQHVLMNVGYQIPVNERDTRSGIFRIYFLWDWFDGPLTSMWRAH
jgi:mono/diheme cytochrome c family protein